MTIVPFLPWMEMLTGLFVALAAVSSLRFFFPGLVGAPVAWPSLAFHNPLKSFPPRESQQTGLKSLEVYRNLVGDFFCEGHVGAVLFGEDLRLRGMNATARVLLGNFQDDWTGRSCREALPEVFAATVEDCWRDRLNLGAGPVTLTLPGDQRCSLTGSAMLLRDRTGDFFGVALFFWEGSRTGSDGYPAEWSEEIRRYKHLASVGVHAAGMAHEIKNPLVALKTFAELLPSKFNDPEFRETFSKLALNEIRRIDGIVNDLLDFARPKKPLLRKADPLQILQEAMDIVAIQAKENRIEIVREYCKEELLLALDVEQMRRVFLNVLLNAIEAMPKGGKLTVETRLKNADRRGVGAPGSELEMRFTDTGPGIAPEDLERIFEPFYTTKKKGSGLGLAISRRIVENHEGRIAFQSGKGGTVCVIALPLKREKQAASRVSALEMK